MFDDFTWSLFDGDCGLSAEERLQMLKDYFQLIEDMEYIEHLFRHDKHRLVQPILSQVNKKLDTFIPKIKSSNYLAQTLHIVYSRLHIQDPE